jgi:hypothetical protein
MYNVNILIIGDKIMTIVKTVVCVITYFTVGSYYELPVYGSLVIIDFYVYCTSNLFSVVYCLPFNNSSFKFDSF